MPVVTYGPKHVEAIVTLYNATAAGLPYCCPMDVAWFTEVIAAKHGVAPERLWVYEEDGGAVGYLQCSFVSRSRDEVAFDRRVAGIDALCFAPDRLDVAAALLERTIAYLRGQGTREVGCVSGAYHQRLALERAGFYLQQASHMWLTELDEAPTVAQPARPVECRVAAREFTSLAERDSWRGIEAREATAWLDGRQVGACLYSLLPCYQRQRGYAAAIGALSVSGDVQQGGIATLLVGATLRNLWDAGARQAWVATQACNVAAHGTYTRLGFRRFAEIYVMGREQ